jgi:RHS repeat-associated protein
MLRSRGSASIGLAVVLIGPLTYIGVRGHVLALPPGGVAVTPDGSTTATRTPNTNTYTATFTVKNNGTSTVTYTLTRESSSNITTTGQTYATVTLAAGASINVDVSYNVGAAGSGYVKLWAEGSNGIDSGTWNVPVGPTAKVTPDGGAAPNRVTNTNGYSQNFTVKNEGTAQTTFALTCGGSSNITCTGVTPSSVTLAAGAQNPDVIASYNVGATGTGTLKVTATGGIGSDTGWYSVPIISYAVAVTPDSGEALLHQPNKSGGTSFTVRNTGTQTDTFTFSCAASGNITCDKDGFGYPTITPSSAILAGGAQTSVSVGFQTAESGTGRVYLGASGHSVDQGWQVVPVENATFGVTPAASSTKGAFTSTNYTAFFTLNNPDTAGHTYVLGCNESADITCPTNTLGTIVMGGGQSQSIQVNYTVGAAASGNGHIWLTVNAVDLYHGPGKLNFTVWPNVAHAVSVTPTSGSGPNRSSFTNSYTSTFTVRNVGTSSDTYTFSCQPAANVTCTNVTPSSHLLASLDTVVVTATYNAGASGSSYVRLQASNANANNTGQINFTISPSMGYAVAVTPDAKPIGVLPNKSTSYPFTIRNPGTAQNTYTVAASCTGSAIASGCTPSPTSATIPAGGSTAVTVSYTSGAASTTGTIKLTATQSTDAGVKDSGWANLATGTAQAPVAGVTNVNPGVSVERGLCITVALAGAAAECGDLRLAHALPAVRTMGRARSPTLVYSSAQAHPYPLVAAEVTIPSGAANPDSVEAVLRFNGVEKRRTRWAGSAFSPGRANRITIGLDSLNLPTGLYSYTLEVNSLYPSVLSATPTPSGQIVVINRSQSEFGAGWWLAGVERLYLDSMLWVGGDGSARVYRPAGTNMWAAAAVDRPDTIKKIGLEYVRLLPAKAEVWFDTTGRHVRTISRLRHDTTFFHRDATSGRLDSITVAPASQTLRYKFKYNTTSGLLDSVIAPPAGAAPRAVKLTKNGALVTAIRDPDTSSVGFGYGGYANRISSRTDRLGVTASYFFDAASKVVRDSLDPGFSQAAIVTRLRPHESAGFIGSAALDTSLATAAIDGPRTDVGDSTLFWADRFGAPRRVRNALGYETNVRRENATYPALVTRTQGPIGQVMRAHYDTAGHLDTLTDSATIVNGQPARTRYVWKAMWDAVTRVVPPENDSTVIGIDDSTGHRIWQQDASGTVSRDTFTYYANGLLAGIREAGATAFTTFNYDLRGNLNETISPLGFHSLVYTDNIGRDTLTVSPPLDSAQSTNFLRARAIYDLVDRVTKSVTWAPAMPYTVSGGVSADPTPVPGDSVVVQTLFDREGRPIEVSGPTVESRTYDRAGRLLTKRVGSGPTGLTYDAAGNVTRETYRGGASVTAQFDPLNRVVLRVVPQTAYPRTACVGHMPGPVVGDVSQCLYHTPYFPNIVGDSLEVPADTLVFAYDSAGNMVRADNRYAQVRRTYYLNGALATDTLRVRNYVGTAFGHTYLIRYGYDRDGRRSWMTVGGVSADSFTYAYSLAGALAQVTDIAGRRYALTYTPAGRLDSLKVLPAGSNTPGVKESHQYDADGRMTRRERRTATAGLQLDSLWYTPQGKVTKASASSAAAAQGSLTITNAYNGLGAVVSSQTQSNSSPYWNLEEFRADRIGNVWYSRTRYAAAADKEPSTSFYAADGLLTARLAAFPQGCSPGTVHLDTLYQMADAAGNVIKAGELRQSGCDNNANNHQSASNSYYSSNNKLAVVQKWTNTLHTWEEYWYDALGRRVFTRTRHDLPFCGYPIVCPGFVDRTVWDGDQIIAEQRSSGLDSVTGGAPNFGTVRYVHLLGIDAPVAILDNRFSDARVIHYNWRGLAEASSWTNGNPADEELGAGIKVAWPAGQGVYLQRGNNPNVGQDVTWIGSLPANGQGDAGLVYRRNRYYDPASGRFTQEDPIGIAGGLNLYGLAGGDPITFADPFGLCQTDASDTTKAGCPSTGGSSDSSQTTSYQDDPCKVYTNSSILKGICERVYGPQSDSASSCAARCLGVLYDDLDLEQGALNARNLFGYLFRGHSACYGKCDYSFWKDFVPGLASGSGQRGRPRQAPRITTATERLPSCMMTGGCLRD